MKSVVKDFTKDNDAEMYINVLIDLIEHKNEALNKIQLEGILKFHVKSC